MSAPHHVKIPTAHHLRCRLGWHRPGDVHDGPLSVNGLSLPAQTCLRCGLTATLSPIYAGTAVQWTTAFTDPTDTLTNPTTVTYRYAQQGQPATVWTWAGGQITNPSTGNFIATIDTTSLIGTVVLAAIGTGACAAASATAFVVQAIPV